MRYITLILLILTGSAGLAQTTLLERQVEFGILTYNNPLEPMFDGARHVARVGPGVEFDLGLEGAQNNLDVIPIKVDVSKNRIDITILEVLGDPEFFEAEFNGYVLTFPAECTVIEAVALDGESTTLPMKPGDVSTDGRAVSINMSGQQYKPGDRIGVEIVVADCAIS